MILSVFFSSVVLQLGCSSVLLPRPEVERAVLQQFAGSVVF